MNRLFVRLLFGFLAALVLFAAVTSAVFVWGLERSLAAWSREKQAGAEEYARAVLSGAPPQTPPPEDVPLFVFDGGKNLVWSNRGTGRRRLAQEESLQPVILDGRTAGYYSTGELLFRDDAANRRFLDSLGRSVWIGLGLSFAAAGLSALLLSRGLAGSARRTAEGLGAMARGDLSAHIPERGARELAAIARSANLLARQLEREEDIRRRWAQDIAHDLRTPVAALKAQLEGMKDGVLELIPARIERNLRELSRVERLVLDLEELTRLESPELRLRRSVVRVPELFEELLERFRPELERKRVRVELRAAQEGVPGDADLLGRALSNFLSNAVRHVPEGGRLVLESARAGGQVLLRVTNSGEAIPPPELEKVFDRLYRGEAARSTPGSGLGLTIARRIAEVHGGSARLDSSAESGTTAELSLPLGEG